MNGIVVGNKLVISEDGFKRIVQIGLDDYNVSVFRDFSGVPRVWLGAIAYSNKVYYVAQAKRMYSFRDNNEDPILLAELPESNISGIDICGKTAFVVVNGLSNEGSQKRIGSVYKLDLATGKYEKFIDQLQYPTDIELLYQ